MPKVDVHRGLTLLLLYINILIDSGQHDSVSLQEVKDHIREGTILRFLRQLAATRDFDIFLENSPYGNFERYYVTSLQAIYNAYAGDELRRWGIERRGLCLVMAWSIEILKAGSGWRSGNLAGVEPA